MSEQEKTFRLTIESQHQEYKRLDQLLVHFCKQHELAYSRQQIKQIFSDGGISANCKLELKKLPPLGTEVTLHLPEIKEATAVAENIPLDILFEDEHLIIVNKVAGMVTHPAPGNYSGTLVNALLHHCQDLTGVGDEKRPGIVHRLDKGTSGVMVAAKNQKTHNGLTKLFSTHNLSRKYEAIIVGTHNSVSGKLEAPIGRDPKNRLKMAINAPHSRRAVTYYRILKEYELLTHVELTLETGRTHQIRVHLSSLLNRPIFMDTTYGNAKQHLQRVAEPIAHIAQDYPYPFLHAKHLGFIHPITKQHMEFDSPAPTIFQEVLHACQSSLPN